MGTIWVAGKHGQSRDAGGPGGGPPGGGRPDQLEPGVATLDSAPDLSPVESSAAKTS